MNGLYPHLQAKGGTLASFLNFHVHICFVKKILLFIVISNLKESKIQVVAGIKCRHLEVPKHTCSRLPNSPDVAVLTGKALTLPSG